MRPQFTCRGALPALVREKVVAALAAGQEKEARILDELGRIGCGASLDEIHAAIPEDGKEHSAECPKCGIEVVFRRIPTAEAAALAAEAEAAETPAGT